MPSTSLQLHGSCYQPNKRQALHAHDELQISLVLSGVVRERVGGRLEHGGALSVVVKDPGVMHADDFGEAGAFIVRLSVNKTELADILEHPARAAAWRWTHDAAVAAPFLRILEQGTMGCRTFGVDDDQVADLLASVSSRVAPPVSGAPPAWLREAVAQMVDDWRPGLTVRDVARAADVHPVYLARCVRRWHQVGAGELLRGARLRNAAHAITASEATVSTIAHRHGFSDESHLCRELARTALVTPGRLRRLARASARLLTKDPAPT